MPISKIKLYYIAGVSLILLCGFVLFIYSLQRSTAVTKARSFLTSLDSEKYLESYETWFSDNYKNDLSPNDFSLNMSLYKELFGKREGRKVISYSTDHEFLHGITTITVKFASQFEKDKDATEVLVLKDAYWQGRWEVDQYIIHSKQAITY